MSWVKIDDKAWSHPKIAGLNGNAVRLWLFALCWIAEHGTDGDLPKIALRVLGHRPVDAAALVSAGLWIETATGWRVHDYLVYQPSAADVRAQREAKSAAGRSGGLKSGASRREATPKQVLQENEAAASGLVERKRTPEPEPEPEPEVLEGSNDPRPLGLGVLEDIASDTLVPCPKEILDGDTIAIIASALTVSEAAVRSGLKEFKAYWTIGAGAGRRHSLAKWRAKAREDVRQKAGRGLLLEPETPDPQVPEVDNERRNSERLAREQAYAAQARERLLGGPVATLSTVRRRNGPEAPTETKARETGAQEQQQAARVAQ
jgi:hypothetical protein